MEVAKMMRAAKIPVTTEVVTARESSIEKYVEKEMSVQQAKALISLYYTGICEQTFLEEFVDAFREDDNTFADDCKNEIQILAGICVDELIHCDYEQEDKVISLLGLYAQMYQFLGYESRVPGIEEHLNENLYYRMKKLREEFSVKKENPITELEDNVKFEAEDEEAEYTEEVAGKLNTLVKKMNEIIKIVKNTELRSQIIFEDTELLWWMATGFSDIMEKKYVDMVEQQSMMLPIIMGSELAQRVHIFPGPFAAKSLLRKMLEILPENKMEKDAFEHYIDALEDKAILQVIGKRNPNTPVLYALSKKQENGEGNWTQSFMKKYDLKRESFSPLEVAYEVYIECMMAEYC